MERPLRVHPPSTVTLHSPHNAVLERPPYRPIICRQDPEALAMRVWHTRTGGSAFATTHDGRRRAGVAFSVALLFFGFLPIYPGHRRSR